MAITNTQSLYQYTLGSLSQALAYPVYFLDSSDLTVVATDPTTKLDTTLVLNNDYSVTGAGNQAGGTVTMAPGIIGNIVTIYLTPNLTQPTSFVDNGAFSESTIEQTVDRLCMEIHELNDQLNRTFRIPNSNAVTTPFEVASRLDGIPYFDSVTGALGLITRQSIVLAAQTGMATEAANTILGNDTGSSSAPLALTPLRVRKLAFLNAYGLVGGDYIDKTGNLITTTGKLDTVQAIQTDSFIQFGQVSLGSSSTTATNLIFENDSGGKIWYVRLKGSAANVDNFELYNATDGITGLRLLVTGQPQFPFFSSAGLIQTDSSGLQSVTTSPALTGLSVSGLTSFDFGIGSAPAVVVTGQTQQRLAGADATSNVVEYLNFGGSGTSFLPVFRRIGGTRASPAATPDGANFMGMAVAGYDTGYVTGGNPYLIFADGAWTAGNHGYYHSWKGTPNGSTSDAEWLRLKGGDLTLVSGRLIVTTSRTPSSASDTGVAGTIEWDSGFVYVCTATNTWKRVAISTW